MPIVRKVIFLTLLAACLIQQVSGQGIKMKSEDSVALKQLDIFRGVWVILADRGLGKPPDTTCRTTCKWSPNGKCLVCDQVIFKGKDTTTDICVYAYDSAKKRYCFYIMYGSDRAPGYENLKIDGNRWEYFGQNNDGSKTVLYRTLNVFNGNKDEDLFEVQYSDDQGKTWVTTKRGKSKKL
jgi:hypothetical protein